MHLSLRDATVDDVPLINQWDDADHVKAATGESAFYDDWAAEIGRRPAWREIFIAEVDKRPVGLLHIIDPALEESHYWGAIEHNLRALDIWIGDAADLNSGYGTVMMRLAHQHCFSNPEVNAIIIDPMASNTQVHRFYERLGYEFERELMLGSSLSRVYRLTRESFELI